MPKGQQSMPLITSATPDETTGFDGLSGHSNLTIRQLASSEYHLWDDLIAGSRQASVFCRTWWLNAVCGNIQILGLFINGHLTAGMPLYFKRRWGFRICGMPLLTQTLGIVMEPLFGKRSSVSNRESEILSAFASVLARQSFFYQTFHPNIQNWLPFYWLGFRQTSRFTYIFEDLSNPNGIWETIGHRPRSEIRKAERQGIEISSCSVETLVDLEAKTFARQSLSLPHSPELLRRIYTAARANNAGECFAARDQQGRAHVAGFIVWDRNRAYYLVSGGDPELRTSGATSLMAWHLIKFAAERSDVFDFEGSMLQPVERLFRNFGATLVPYNLIFKFPFWVPLRRW